MHLRSPLKLWHYMQEPEVMPQGNDAPCIWHQNLTQDWQPHLIDITAVSIRGGGEPQAQWPGGPRSKMWETSLEVTQE